MNVLGLAGLEPIEVARQTVRQSREDDVLTYAASLAYHSVLALFPFLIFLLALANSVDQTWLMQRFLSWAGKLLPPQSLEQMVGVLRDVQSSGNVGLLSLGALGAVWAASGGIRSAMNALNRAYDVQESRRPFERYLLSLAYTLGLSLLILLSTALVLVGPAAVEWTARQIGLNESILPLLLGLRYVLALTLLLLLTGVAYSLLPDIRRFRWISPGAVLAVALWLTLSFAFRLYINNFGRFNLLYGSVGAVIILLLYLWISSLVLLVGGEVNSVIERAGAQRTQGRYRRS